MTRTCPFENRSHKELSIESLQIKQNLERGSILRHCTSLILLNSPCCHMVRSTFRLMHAYRIYFIFFYSCLLTLRRLNYKIISLFSTLINIPKTHKPSVSSTQFRQWVAVQIFLMSHACLSCILRITLFSKLFLVSRIVLYNFIVYEYKQI